MGKSWYCQSFLHNSSILSNFLMILSFFLRPWQIFQENHCFLVLFPYLQEITNRYKYEYGRYNATIWGLYSKIFSDFLHINYIYNSSAILFPTVQKDQWMNESPKFSVDGFWKNKSLIYQGLVKRLEKYEKRLVSSVNEINTN